MNTKAPSNWPRAILFDLDGTLIDSLPDLAAAVNLTLSEEGKEVLGTDAVRGMIGHGVGKLVQRAFAARDTALEGDELARRVDRMMDHYLADLTGRTVPLPGAGEILRACFEHGIRAGVITNKPQQATSRILRHFGWDALIDVALGGDSVPNKKPHPDMVLRALELMRVPVEHALMVGDSAADVGAARAACIKVIVVEGGYTDNPAASLGADRVISSLNELLPFEGLEALTR